MSKPAAAAAVAFITLLARLTLLPGVDAQFYQVRGDNPSTCRDRHLGTLLKKSTSSPTHPLVTSLGQPAGLALREHPTAPSGFADVNF